MLTRLIYHSENHLGADGGGMVAELNNILDVSNRNNRRAGVTGALLFDTLWFMQVLEGEREAVSAIFRRIVVDPRHDAVALMDVRPIEQPLFSNWWMGLCMLRGDNTPLFARHGLGPRLNPRLMTGEQAVGLAFDLARAGLDRRLEVPA